MNYNPMTFDEWLNRPVYKAQCKTFEVAKAILKLPKGDIYTSGNHPVLYLRLVPAHRCELSLALRKQVAAAMKQIRKNKP